MDSLEKRLLVADNFKTSFTPFWDEFSEKEKREIQKCKELFFDTYVTPLQEARRERIAALQEKQRKQEEERLERERAAEELRRKQKEIVQEAIARSQRAQQEQVSLMKKLGIQGVKLHTCRHTAATKMMASRLAPEVVKQILGHADITTTLNIYTHPDVSLLVNGMATVSCRLHGFSFANKAAIRLEK